jgi:hypothetical protein
MVGRPRVWRLALAHGLLAAFLLAQQLAFVCCLSCVLGEAPGSALQSADEDAQEPPGDHAPPEGACATCGLCAHLLAAAVSSHPAEVRGFLGAPHESRSGEVRIAAATVPFASRAPPLLAA